MNEPTYLDVPFAEKDEAKSLGARWDPKARKWYVPPGREVAPFARWFPSGISPTGRETTAHLEASSPASSESMAILRPPIYVAEANSRCWKCSRPTAVIAIGAQDVEFDGERAGDVILLSDVEELPRDLAHLLAARWPLYRIAYSKTAGGRYYMNHCSTCGAKLGDFFLHSEPGGAFFPIDGPSARAVVLRRLPLTQRSTVRGVPSITAPNLLQRHARRQD